MTSLINPTSIPPITALRQELDYGDPHLSRCQAFYDSVRVFRKTFVSSQGREGSSLHDWRSREHQTGLGEMVRSYLELHRNGRLFWPDDRSQSRANKLKYSTDSARIKKIMRQLFWRLNIQQHRNIKYKRNKGKTGENEIPSGSGLDHDNRTDSNVVAGASASRDAARAPNTPRSSTFPNITVPPLGVNTSVSNTALREDPSNSLNGRGISEDPYRVPDSPDLRILSPPTISADTSTGVGNDGRQVAPFANMDPSATRPRGDDRSPTPPMSSKRAGKQPAGLRTSRSSPRKRKQRDAPGFATAEQISAAFRDLEPIVESPAPAEPYNLVTSDCLPTFTREATYPLRPTVESVTDEEESVNAFVDKAIVQLNTETGPQPAGHSHSAADVAPSVRFAPAEAAPGHSPTARPVTRQSSPIPVVSCSVPAGGRGVDDDHMPIENNAVPRAPPMGQGRVRFLYRMVCPSQGQIFFWKPEGGFRNKTLAKLEEETSVHLEWSQFQYLHFRLIAPKTRAEQMVCRGEEDQFDDMKRELAGFIRRCIAETPSDKTVLVKIDIEPLSDVNSVRNSADSEAMDLDWE